MACAGAGLGIWRTESAIALYGDEAGGLDVDWAGFQFFTRSSSEDGVVVAGAAAEVALCLGFQLLTSSSSDVGVVSTGPPYLM